MTAPAREVYIIDIMRRTGAAPSAAPLQYSMSWPSLAFKLAVGASSLKKLGSGGRASFPMVMRLTGWLSRPLAEFTKLSER